MKYYSTCTSISDAPAEFDPFITLLLGMRDPWQNQPRPTLLKIRQLVEIICFFSFFFFTIITIVLKENNFFDLFCAYLVIWPLFWNARIFFYFIRVWIRPTWIHLLKHRALCIQKFHKIAPGIISFIWDLETSNGYRIFAWTT